MITLTLKGIPKETHRELKKRAAANRRSLNSEVILLLESSVQKMPPVAPKSPAEVRSLLRRVRANRAKMKFTTTTEEISRFKREGRA